MSFHWKSEDSDMTEENVSENMSKAKQKELQAAEKNRRTRGSQAAPCQSWRGWQLRRQTQAV